MTPSVKAIRKLIEDLMRTYDDFLHCSMGPDGPIVTLASGRKIVFRVEDSK